MIIEIEIIKFNNSAKQKLCLHDESFLKLENDFLINRYVNMLVNNIHRVRSSHYKSISGLSGSKRKIRPQKRMGRSRQGSIREIHMRGGAIKFGFSGNKNRDNHLRYRTKLAINKKEKTLGQKIILANKIKYSTIHIVDSKTILNDDIKIIKTKTMQAELSKVCNTKSQYGFIYETNALLHSISNIRNISLQNIASMNILYMLKYKTLCFELHAITKFLDKLNIKYTIEHA
jgi:ribosomal protein L4